MSHGLDDEVLLFYSLFFRQKFCLHWTFPSFFLFSFWLPLAVSCSVQMRSHTAGHLQQLRPGSTRWEGVTTSAHSNQHVEKISTKCLSSPFPCKREKFLESYVTSFWVLLVHLYLFTYFKLLILKYRFSRGCKKKCKGRSCAPFIPPSLMFTPCITLVHYQHCKVDIGAIQTLFRFHQLYMHSFVFACVVPCNFVTQVASCNCYYSQDAEVCYYYKATSCYLFRTIPIPSHPQIHPLFPSFQEY